MINYFLGVILIICTIFIVKKIINDYKKGKGSCGLNCPHCKGKCMGADEITLNDRKEINKQT